MKSKFFYISALHFLNDGFYASLLLFFPFIAKDLKLDLTQVGMLGTSLNFLPIVVAVPAIFLAKKIGSFPSLLLALLCYGLGYIFLGAVAGFISAAAIFLLAGVGFGLFHPIGFSLVSRWADHGNIGKIMGNFTAWGDVGRLVLSSGVTFFIVATTWRFVAEVYGGAALVVLIYLFIFHFNKNYLPIDEITPHDKTHDFKQLFKNRQFIFAILACCLDNLASSPLFLFLPFLLLSKHIPPTFLSSFAAAFLVGNMLGKSVIGHWVDKLGSAKVFITTEILMAMGVVAIALLNTYWLIAVVAVFLGIATRGTVPATRSLVYSAVAKSKNFERANGLTEFANMAAAAAAPVVLGIISDRFGIISAFWTIAGCALLATLPALVLANWPKDFEAIRT